MWCSWCWDASDHEIPNQRKHESYLFYNCHRNNWSVLWIVNPSSHYVVVFSYASYLDWKLLSLNCFQLMMLKSIRCQLEETSGEFTLWFGHLLPNAFGSLGPWRVIVGLPSTKGSTAYAEAVTSSLKHCSKVICSVSEKRADFGHWKIVDVRAKKQGVAADVCDILCLPAKLYSQTSRNLFPPSFCLCSHSSFINGFLLLRLPSVCSCLDGRCSNTSPSQIKRRLYNSRQHRTHKCNFRAQPSIESFLRTWRRRLNSSWMYITKLGDGSW